MNVEDVSKF